MGQNWEFPSFFQDSNVIADIDLVIPQDRASEGDLRN